MRKCGTKQEPKASLSPRAELRREGSTFPRSASAENEPTELFKRVTLLHMSTNDPESTTSVESGVTITF